MAEILNPQDAELEEVILGACLIGREAMPMVADRLGCVVFSDVRLSGSRGFFSYRRGKI